jgi:hypothetical protein
MSTNVLKVAGDYKVIAKNGDIIFDLLGPTTGTVRILGNLDVYGTATSVISTSTYVKDKILVLNYRDDGSVPDEPTGNLSGILIDSFDGSSDYATLLFNADQTWNNSSGTAITGVFEFKSSGTIYSSLRVGSIQAGIGESELQLANNNDSAVLNVKKSNPLSASYYDLIVTRDNDDDIPNKKYVDSITYSGTEFAKKLIVGNTFIEIGDNSVSTSTGYYSPVNKIFAALGTSSNVVFRLEGSEAEIQGLTINDYTIQVNNSTTNLVLDPGDGNSVEVTTGLAFREQTTATTPIPKPFETVVYYKEPPKGGGTGLYFVNATTNLSDELVSRRKAIIYGIIF